MVLSVRRIKTDEIVEATGISQSTVFPLLRRYITVDEPWIHHYTPETEEQSKQWVFEGERTPKKAKTVKSAGKVTATVFWDARRIIYTEYLKKG